MIVKYLLVIRERNAGLAYQVFNVRVRECVVAECTAEKDIDKNQFKQLMPADTSFTPVGEIGLHKG